MGILRHECHLHLYGCLDKHEVWLRLKERSRQFHARFEWYIAEHKRLTGAPPQTDLWWNEDNGLKIFVQDFVCNRPMSFDTFQAKFNLLIALFPPNPDDLDLAKTVFQSDQRGGGVKEYRVFLPLYLTSDARSLYLRRLIYLARDYETSQYRPRLAISIQRQDEDAWNSYEFLLQFLHKNSDIAPWITGIDFCGNELGHPPSQKRRLFKRVAVDNQQRHHQLAILYHVGEMWQNLALHSAARWCVEAVHLGVTRLGHALALGMNPETLRGRCILENVDESAAHLSWLKQHGRSLHEFGFSPNDYGWVARQTEISRVGEHTQWIYHDDLIEHTKKLQDALMNMVSISGAAIECCPTSNIRIGGLRDPRHHPLQRFLAHHIPITIATDDPGIFDLTLDSEERFVSDHLGVSKRQLQSANDLAQFLCLGLTQTRN
jgi:hypothetical protein